MRSALLLQLRVAGVTLDPRDGRAVVVLTHEPSGGAFPLWVGDQDAAAIARGVSGRPPAGASDTHGLIAVMVRALGARIEHVEITGVLAGVVTAEIAVADAAGVQVVAARASDAVVLALEFGAPIVVHAELLKQVAARVAEAEERTSARSTAAEPLSLTHAERWSQLLAHLSSKPSSKNFEG